MLTVLWLVAVAVEAATSPAFRAHGPWTPSRRALSEDERVTWWVGVKAARPYALDDAFTNVTTPSHPRFMRYLSRAAVDALTQPEAAALPALTTWLGKLNTTYSAASNLLVVESSILELEALLNTTLTEFAASGSHRVVKATTPIHVPEVVAAYVDFVSVTLPASSIVPSATDATATLHPSRRLDAKTLITPTVLRGLYHVPADLVVTDPQATQSFAVFCDASYSETDLTDFNETMGTPRAQLAQRGNRPNDPRSPHAEPSLDVQYLTAMAPLATTYAWLMRGRNPFSALDEPFVAWADDVLSRSSPPLVHSISYADDERHLAATAPNYLRSLDRLLQKMALRGLTVIVASGDDGAMGLRHRQRNLSLAIACSQGGPQWPASSPYVTSVGATMLLDGAETVCMADHGGRITSGGGFSSVYAQPAYQARALASYIARAPVPTTYANLSGRGYPDVSAIGAHYRVRVHGKWRSISGTSASTPVLAAMVTLWNDARLRAGKSPVGFLNALLYRFPAKDAFFDITVGDNRAGKLLKDNAPRCPHGFDATRGWDAATGLGAPRFHALLPLVLHAEDVLRGNLTALTIPSVVNDTRTSLLAATKSSVIQSVVKSVVTSMGATSWLRGAGIFGGTLALLVCLATAFMTLCVKLCRRRPARSEKVPDGHDTTL
ncbi:hypothetical protein SPRG_05100 [Saprolegnia parasitica CBS 223.65]|uniref:subtilisin n=1 Tax=Saprolegnia parasitica (strain CBS 223.65) TaxID=695850 RepID=A0A067CI20_SAPPC|nr:hypothetical protein SPRG_05100 [Saprolegnia parasitica CBS 223.65]KDO30389.1 hypothetical protein SPRG_05100 [Saprolegnia parasitica CBS 223.65]|eukprot:XP_012198999.1 hypothetical protein SPRG_05100 [Saprolegnia parasitica CBS 223.65]